jgi:hypothetical protein
MFFIRALVLDKKTNCVFMFKTFLFKFIIIYYE